MIAGNLYEVPEYRDKLVVEWREAIHLSDFLSICVTIKNKSIYNLQS